MFTNLILILIARNEYDKKSKTSLDTLNDHFMNSKHINNNYSSLSDLNNSDYIATSFNQVNKPCDRYGFFIDSEDECETKT